MAGYAEKGSILQVLKRIVVGDHLRQTLIRLGTILAIGLLAIVIFSFILLPVQITGPSMSPTFKDGEINFINRLAYLRHEPKRGDVVGIRMAGKHLMYYKRIVGLPGESVSFMGGQIYINGKPLPEPYLKYTSSSWEAPPKQLGADDYYFVGDNRSMPFEDHEKGAAPRKRIIGRVLFGGTS